MTTWVSYRCQRCLVEEHRVSVPSRGPQEPLFSWWDKVMDKVVRDHRGRSPKCPSHCLDVTADGHVWWGQPAGPVLGPEGGPPCA